MHSRSRFIGETSTPKRRRLGTGKIRTFHTICDKENSELLNSSPIQGPGSAANRCESPALPCNQIQYMHDSGRTSNIPCSPDVLLEGNRESLAVSMGNIDNKQSQSASQLLAQELEDISDDMFHSKLEFEKSQNHVDNLITTCDKKLRDNIEESFQMINQSICGIRKNDRSSLFESKDSFLLDVKENDIFNENEVEENPKITDIRVNNNGFYGLPMITRGLFKSYRNIEKFYDWQEECLDLEAIKLRRNLIYALPTSGGKTLVAEVLMLREVLNRKHNALFILPFVAIVQEKIWSLSPFAVQLEFLVEEYAAGKGHIPPKKRRQKKSIYIATIEKGLALVRSLIELNRLDEIGLIVVDELHLIGEPGRGATLEILLATVMFASRSIQIVGMSATIGNLNEIASFLQAAVYSGSFRPVQLVEYVKLDAALHRLAWGKGGLHMQLERELTYDYSPAAMALDPDMLGGLVSEVVPGASCLVFCPTKRNAENVAALLTKLQRREMTEHRRLERLALERALVSEGANKALSQHVRCGVAYHHAGLAGDERVLLEQAFRSGVISVLCCTSTLAAGVNLPAQRVIIRAPCVGREFISLANYRQMVGRAGRAGVCDKGESVIICSNREWPKLRSVLSGGLSAARSCLPAAVDGLIMSSIALEIATTRAELNKLLQSTLMGVTAASLSVNTKEVCDASLHSLLQSGAVLVDTTGNSAQNADDSHTMTNDCYVYNDSKLTVSKLGKAAIKGCMDLMTAQRFLQDLEMAAKGLVLQGSLHLLYLVTPHDAAGIRPDYSYYYSLYCNFDDESLRTSKMLGITETNAIRMMTGKPITNVSENVLCRFYLALMLHDLWKQVPFAHVADKYNIPRGTVQAVMTSSSAFASQAHRLCEELVLWPWGALFSSLAARLQYCAAPHLDQLMQLPAVRKARAMQLMRAGYKRLEELARASVEELTGAVEHLSKSAAHHLISAARMMLIEKVENLRAEAEDVMEELNV